MQKIFSFILFLLIATGTSGQTNIYVKDRSSDETGRRFVYYLKETFNTSSSFSLLGFRPKDKPVLVLEVITMDKNDGDKSLEGIVTMYTIIWYISTPNLQWSYYLNSTMGFSGKSRIQETAVDIVALTKKLVDDISRMLNEE